MKAPKVVLTVNIFSLLYLEETGLLYLWVAYIEASECIPEFKEFTYTVNISHLDFFAGGKIKSATEINPVFLFGAILHVE